jgi:hypothetical protein
MLLTLLSKSESKINSAEKIISIKYMPFSNNPFGCASMSTNVTKGIGREYNIGKYYEAYCIVVLGKFD